MAGLLARVIFELSFLLIFLSYYRHEQGVDAQLYESASNDDSRQAKGRNKYKELERDAENSQCWRAALDSLDSTCSKLTDTRQMRLALSFANCHLESTGRQTYPCTTAMDVKDCINKDIMNDSDFQIYTQFYTHANNLCYYLQSRLWQQQTETTINRLSSTSQETVDKLEQSLDYHREMESKQQQSLQNQEAIMEQDNKIAQSLAHTKLDMDKAFQEMSEKAEKQKFILDDMLGKLTKGLSNIQWLLSLMLGEFITLETGAFFFVTIFVVTFAPQFGHSRLFMYLVLVGYGVLEGVVTRTVLWWTLNSAKDASLTTLHTVLWYTRWLCTLVLVCVYAWQWFADTRQFRKQMELLEDVHQMVGRISSSSGSLPVTPSHRPSLTPSHRPSLTPSHPHSAARHHNGSAISVARTIEADGSDDDTVDADNTSCSSQQHSDSSSVSSQPVVLPGDILSGKQLVDFLSGVYLKAHAQRYLVDGDRVSLSSFGSDSDTTYQQPIIITTTTTTQSSPPITTTYNGGNNSNISSSTPLTRTPLAMNAPPRSHFRPPTSSPSLRLHPVTEPSVSNGVVVKDSLSSLASYSPEKEVAEEKARLSSNSGDSTPLSSRGKQLRSRSRSRTPISQATTKQSTQYNLRPRGTIPSPGCRYTS